MTRVRANVASKRRARLVVGRLAAGDGTRHALQAVPTPKPAKVERLGQEMRAIVGTREQLWEVCRVRSEARACKLCGSRVRLGERCWRPRLGQPGGNELDRVCSRCWPLGAEKGKNARERKRSAAG